MTHDELQAIKARAEAATPGPWRQGYASMSCTKDHGGLGHHPGPPQCVYDKLTWHESNECVSAANGDEICGPDDYGNAPRENDCTFIAHARTDVPALVAEVERLRHADVESMRRAFVAGWDAQRKHAKDPASTNPLIDAWDEYRKTMT